MTTGLFEFGPHVDDCRCIVVGHRLDLAATPVTNEPGGMVVRLELRVSLQPGGYQLLGIAPRRFHPPVDAVGVHIGLALLEDAQIGSAPPTHRLVPLDPGRIDHVADPPGHEDVPTVAVEHDFFPGRRGGCDWRLRREGRADQAANRQQSGNS